MTLTHDRRAELLGACPLFDGIDAGRARRASPTGRSRSTSRPTTSIARQGEIGTGFFVVIRAASRVVRDGDDRPRLGPGEFFGELSVLDGVPRDATVTAEVPTSCLALASWDFETVSSRPAGTRARDPARGRPGCG